MSRIWRGCCKIKTDHLLYVSIAVGTALMGAPHLLGEQGREVTGVVISGLVAWKAKRSAGNPSNPPPPVGS